MPEIVNVHDAKTNLSKLLERAHNGEEIILAKAGKPYARLVPLAAATKPRVLGALSGVLPPIDDDALFVALPEEELEAWGGGTWD